MNLRRAFLILLPYLWLLVFFLAPFIIVLKISLSDPAIAQPPYLPVFDLSKGWSGFVEFLRQLDFDSFAFLLQDSLYINAFLGTAAVRTGTVFGQAEATVSLGA